MYKRNVTLVCDRYDRKSAVDWSDKLVNHSPLLTRALDKGILVHAEEPHGRDSCDYPWHGYIRIYMPLSSLPLGIFKRTNAQRGSLSVEYIIRICRRGCMPDIHSSRFVIGDKREWNILGIPRILFAETNRISNRRGERRRNKKKREENTCFFPAGSWLKLFRVSLILLVRSLAR